MNDKIFFGLFVFLSAVVFALFYFLYFLLQSSPHLSVLLMVHGLNTLSCYILLGMGLGLPIIIIATMLGWVHLVMLITGNVDPHLSKEGLFKVLGTLFKNL